MASKLMLAIIVIAAAEAILLKVAEATAYMVGGEKGWKPGVNYTEWVAGKEFFVGDNTIVSHNVFKVTGPESQSCTVPANGELLTSGNGVITLTKPGKKWYICGFPGHCNGGQKLVIIVKMSSGSSLPGPLPTIPSSPQTGAGSAISPYSAVIFAASAFLMKVFSM